MSNKKVTEFTRTFGITKRSMAQLLRDEAKRYRLWGSNKEAGAFSRLAQKLEHGAVIR